MKKNQIEELFKDFDILQKKYGDKKLKAIYGCGKIKNPDVCFVFMNPTAKNISAHKEWKGFRAPWLGTKNIWRMFVSLDLFSKEILEEINLKKDKDWTSEFAEKVYKDIQKRKFYITNLSKATKTDATNPSNAEFKNYLDLFKKEISILKPKVIITFGNQVSSVILNKNIKVGENRKTSHKLIIDDKEFLVFPVYYPVGQGQRNIEKAREDLKWIFKIIKQ